VPASPTLQQNQDRARCPVCRETLLVRNAGEVMIRNAIALALAAGFVFAATSAAAGGESRPDE
jgi:uncharacterized paraquat-inducible protein A